MKLGILFILLGLFMLKSTEPIERQVRFNDKYGFGIKIQELGLTGWKDTGQEVPLASRENAKANEMYGV